LGTSTTPISVGRTTEQGMNMVEFRILRAARRVHSKLTTLCFKRADFGLFRDLLSRVP